MDRFVEDDLKNLMEIEKRGTPCVSMYMPAGPAAEGGRLNPIRFKNLLARAAEDLERRKMRTPNIAQILAPARKLVDDALLRQGWDGGLAVFLAGSIMRTFRLSLGVPELVVTGERFHLKPLLPLLQAGGRFYVLGLSRNDIRLIEGTRTAVREINVDAACAAVDRALSGGGREKLLQFHTGTPPSPAKRPAIYHGQGGGVDSIKDEVIRFFRAVNRETRALLGPGHAPLVLAGVEFLFPLYHEVNTYPCLLEEGIPGSPEDLDAIELRDRALDLTEPFFRRKMLDKKRNSRKRKEHR